MKRAAAEALIGAILVAGMVAGFTAITVVGKINPFLPAKTIYALFDDVNFVGVGANVVVSGMSVGRVADLELDERGGVLATMVVEPGVRVHDGYSVMVRSISTLGGRFVQIDRGDRSLAEASTSRESPLRGRIEPDFMPHVGAMIREAEPHLTSAVANVKDIMAKIDDAEGTIGKALNEPELRENLERFSVRFEITTATLRRMSDKLDAGAGTLGRFLSEARFRDALDMATEKIGAIVDRVSGGDGAAGALASDEELSDALDRAGGHLRAVLDALTTEEGVFRDASYDKMRADLERTLDHLDGILEKVADGEGPLLVLLQDEGVAEDLRRIQAHLEAIGDYPDSSTVSRFMRDPKVVGEAERSILDYMNSTSDVNEAIPVSPTLESLIRSRISAPRVQRPLAGSGSSGSSFGIGGSD